MTDERNAPGCFGSPTAIMPTAEPCLSCPGFAACREAAKKRALALETEWGVGAIGHMRRKFDIPEDPEHHTVKRMPATSKAMPVLRAAMTRVEGLPKKASELVRRLEPMKVDIRGEVAAGRNPFEERAPAFMRVICDGLIAGGFTKRELKEMFLMRLGWRDGAASAHVSLSLPALRHLGVIEEHDGTFRLKEEPLR